MVRTAFRHRGMLKLREARTRSFSREEGRLGSIGARRRDRRRPINHQRAQLLFYFHANGGITDKQSCRWVAAGAAALLDYPAIPLRLIQKKAESCGIN
jgi:hypothetical protein